MKINVYNEQGPFGDKEISKIDSDNNNEKKKTCLGNLY